MPAPHRSQFRERSLDRLPVTPLPEALLTFDTAPDVLDIGTRRVRRSVLSVLDGLEGTVASTAVRRSLGHRQFVPCGAEFAELIPNITGFEQQAIDPKSVLVALFLAILPSV